MERRSPGTLLGALALFAVGSAACAGAAAPPAPSSLYGEVHVHQFRGGVHPGALFVAPPVAASATRGDSLFPPATTLQSGRCTLTRSPAQGDAPLPGPIAAGLADAGLVRIVGGAGIAEVDLALRLPEGSYLPASPLPPGRPIFDGGETLRISGAGGASAAPFAGSLQAPRPLTLTAPAALALADGADLPIAWVADHASAVSATLVVSTSDGRWAIVACDSSDEAGQLALPAALLAALPPPPRDLQLEVSRDQIGVALGPVDTGVLIHAAYEVSLNAHQP
jgi:hypothetical protein